MKNFIQTYLYFIKITIRKKMMYRASYIAGIIGQWLGYGTILATLYIVIKKFKLLGGWDANEIAFLYSLSLISYAIGASVFYTPCTGLANKIRTGEFDQVLTRPINPLIHEILHGFNTGYLGHFILALLIMTSSLVKKNIILSNINILFIIVSIIGGALIQAAILILSSIGSFFMINDNPVLDFLLFQMKDFIQYPITIYNRILQTTLTFILPFAFINFYPASKILNKDIPTGFPSILQYIGPLVGLILFIVSIILWNVGVSKYKSTGT